MMNKLYAAAWQGRWGWRDPFYEWFKQQTNLGFELVDRKEDANIVFQGDLSDWRDTVQLPASVRIMANVLDFGEWVNNGNLNNETVEYVKEMQKREASFTAISPKVQTQLLQEFGINAQLFYYPSQVTFKLIKSCGGIQATSRKRKQIISFCRHGDPGKAIPEAIAAWKKSNAVANGWRWILAGPEKPRAPLPHGVMHVGYHEPQALYMMVAQSKYVFMPSYGEGLGLPIIEGLLVGTPFITRDIEPMKTIWSKFWNYPVILTDDSNISDTINNALEFSEQPDYRGFAERGYTKAYPWIREVAFSSLVTYINYRMTVHE
jgi:hypothetical protein